MPTPTTIVLTNQFGETSINDIGSGGTTPAIEPIADQTLLGNISGSTAPAAALTLTQVVAAAPNKSVAAHSLLVNDTAGTAALAAKTTQQFSTLLPAKAGVTALSPLASDADLPTTVAQLNALLAALKAVV